VKNLKSHTYSPHCPGTAVEIERAVNEPCQLANEAWIQCSEMRDCVSYNDPVSW
jgi:hypothetical protein